MNDDAAWPISLLRSPALPVSHHNTPSTHTSFSLHSPTPPLSLHSAHLASHRARTCTTVGGPARERVTCSVPLLNEHRRERHSLLHPRASLLSTSAVRLALPSSLPSSLLCSFLLPVSFQSVSLLLFHAYLSALAIRIHLPPSLPPSLPSGTTLHSFAGIGLGDDPVEVLKERASKSRVAGANWQACEVLIVDEVSAFFLSPHYSPLHPYSQSK